jgi:hypothetical protein
VVDHLVAEHDAREDLGVQRGELKRSRYTSRSAPCRIAGSVAGMR